MKMIINSLRHRSVKAQATPDLLVGRTILDVTYNATSYGMGGNGFFGLHLDKRGRRKDEWLLLTLFAADNWLSMSSVKLYRASRRGKPGLVEKSGFGLSHDHPSSDADWCTLLIESIQFASDTEA